MLRAYAAWAEDTSEVDVEAIKRSMNATAPSRDLAVILSVAEALQAKRALEIRSPHRAGPALTDCSAEEIWQ